MEKVLIETDQQVPHRRIYQTRREVSAAEQAAIMRLPGVVGSASVTRYDITVWKGHAFTWEEIEPAILAVLEKE
jgi:hypothetical protein